MELRAYECVDGSYSNKYTNEAFTFYTDSSANRLYIKLEVIVAGNLDGNDDCVYDNIMFFSILWRDTH